MFKKILFIFIFLLFNINIISAFTIPIENDSDLIEWDILNNGLLICKYKNNYSTLRVLLFSGFFSNNTTVMFNEKLFISGSYYYVTKQYPLFYVVDKMTYIDLSEDGLNHNETIYNSFLKK